MFMWATTKSFFTALLLSAPIISAPVAVNVYVIPFDNIKNDVAIGWLSDALSDIILSKSD